MKYPRYRDSTTRIIGIRLSASIDHNSRHFFTPRAVLRAYLEKQKYIITQTGIKPTIMAKRECNIVLENLWIKQQLFTGN